MNFKAPQFWQHNGLLSWLLAPLGLIYGWIVSLRLKGSPKKVSVPVICVGNLTMGGTGKTPTVIALTQKFQELGHNPHILTRGYGGKFKCTLQVIPTQYSATEVGDEALLLSRIAPTWIGADRYQSALAAIKKGATLLIMDDGLQNPGLYQDFKITVFDGQLPLENQYTFPAGPFRENFSQGLKRIDHLMLLNFTEIPAWAAEKSYTLAKTVTTQQPTADRYIAFAGIGYPDKFFNLLRHQKFNLIETIPYPDHYDYSDQEITHLLQKAEHQKAQLITTEKDLVKLPKDVKKNIQSLAIRLDMNLTELVNKVLKFF